MALLLLNTATKLDREKFRHFGKMYDWNTDPDTGVKK